MTDQPSTQPRYLSLAEICKAKAALDHRLTDVASVAEALREVTAHVHEHGRCETGQILAMEDDRGDIAYYLRITDNVLYALDDEAIRAAHRELEDESP